MSQTLIFDIETGPLSDTELRAKFVIPDPKPHPGDFDPASVNLNGIKDENKKAAKIEACRQKHEAAVASYKSDCAAAVDKAWTQFVDDAAKHPSTGLVLAIGVMLPSGEHQIFEQESERDLIEAFWMRTDFGPDRGRYIGHNICGFDLPFLIRRSWLHKLEPPAWAIPAPFYSFRVIDLMRRWGCGEYKTYVGLDELARFFGTPGKMDGVTGKDFANLWRTNRRKAKEYLVQDLEVTRQVAAGMQVF